MGIQDLGKLRYGAMRIRILNNYESDSSIEANVTFINKYCWQLVLRSN